MNQIRLTLMYLVGLCVLMLPGAAGCAGSLDESARVLGTTAVVVDTSAKAMTAADRVTQEAIVAEVRSSTLTVDAARGQINAYRAKRADVLKVSAETRATLDSLRTTLAQLPVTVAANDAAIDAELASLQH